VYLASDAFPGCTTAKITGEIGLDLKAYVEGRFVVGPIAEDFFKKKTDRIRTR
jgi:hypothetical protein